MSYEKGSKIFFKEKIIGHGGTSVVCTYRAEDGDRIVLKVGYCGKSNALDLGTTESETAISIAESSLSSQEAGFPLCSSCSYNARELLRAPISYQYVAPCFYSIFPYREDNLAQWLLKNPSREAHQIKEMFLQIITILKSLRARDFYYCDIKPSNFFVRISHDNQTKLEIGDLGGLVKFGDPHITISPSQLPAHMLTSLSWKNIDETISLLLGELLLQMLIASSDSRDDIKPLNNLIGCLQNKNKETCETLLLSEIKSHLAPGIDINRSLDLDLISLSFMLTGFRNYYLSWLDIQTLQSPVNVVG